MADMPVRRDPGAQLASVNPSSGGVSYAPAVPPNMYANLLAGYQQAYGANLNQQGATALRNKQEYDAEMFKQEQALRRKNKFWNRMKQGLSTGLIQAVSSIPSTALRMGASMLSGPGSQQPGTDPQVAAAAAGNPGGEVTQLDRMQGRVPANDPWANFMAMEQGYGQR